VAIISRTFVIAAAVSVTGVEAGGAATTSGLVGVTDAVDMANLLVKQIDYLSVCALQRCGKPSVKRTILEWMRQPLPGFTFEEAEFQRRSRAGNIEII
jgi:hypothetical protein